MSRRALFVVALATFLVLSGFVVVLEGWSAVSPGLAAAQTVTPSANEPVRSVTVIGEGKVTAKPDQAQIQLGVETISTTVAAATQDNNAQMAAILAALKKLGIADKDIQTSNFSIYLERVPDRGIVTEGDSSAEVTRYHVSNQVRVTVRDLTTVSNVIDQVVAAGDNNVWGVSFTVADPKVLQKAARAAAVADAKAKAEELAELNGVTVGKVLSISEVVTGSPVFSAALSKTDALGGGTPVEAGELEFSLQLQIVYNIQ